MAGIRGNAHIEKLGNAIAVWGGLAGLLLWTAVLYLHGNNGLVELFVLLGVPLVTGGVLRLLAKH